MLFWKKKKKILIIEDNEDLVIFLKKILESEGYTVFSVTRGEGAIDLAIANKPDVILLDILLPDIPGAEVERLLKEAPPTRNIPIVYMTALVSREDEENSKRPESTRLLLAKPVTKDRLLQAIRSAVAK
ncbi:MAG: response regulator [Candidatus Omnitrophica bacterium]|nr:response regulator [Candidatus Omnitrophota bacterium]